jgi:hypothetical protein
MLYISEVSAMDSRRKTSGFLLVCGLVAIIVSLAMIVMGLLHAAPIDSQKMPDGVLRQNCTVIENCGQFIFMKLLILIPTFESNLQVALESP